MPALPADIARAIRRSRVVTRTDTAIQSAFASARDAAETPEPGFFESGTDAASCLTLKAALNGQFRRRFAVELADEVWIDPLSGVPTWSLTDSETGASADMLLTRITLNLEDETTQVELLG